MVKSNWPIQFAPVDLLEDPHPGLLVDSPGEDDIVDGVDDDRPVGLGGGLAE